ncbi:TetR/AcrR family transcriptional regulator [Glutamicibacter ardleyensis]|uniref:TetR/AcrR family transcriptional regulator n=1 Tax=Glutamicibacter ardleyensis TaxID=225894 RepID=UPI003FD1B067
MPRTTKQNEALRSATRSAVETAAVRMFALHGFAATNMRQIAVEAGISAGSIYRHYASKEVLFDELIDQASRGLGAVATQLSNDGDPLSMIRSFTEEYVADLAANNGAAEFYMMINQGVTTDTPKGTSSRLAASQRLIWQSVATLIARGQTEGQILQGDPAQLTAHYFAMLTGITTLHFTLQVESAEPDADLILRVFTGGLQ